MNWPVIEVVIGLAFFFWLMSLVASAINEAIAGAFALRARGLERALVRMLGSQYAKDLLDTPFVSSQRKNARSADITPTAPKSRWANLVPFRSRGPSYLPASNFADALQHLFAGGGAGFSLDLAAVEDAGLREVLSALAEKVGNDATRFRGEVEHWFDSTMDRASGWYKRRAQAILLVIGLVLAAGANLSALTVGERLWTDASLRSVVNAEAQQATSPAPTTPDTSTPAGPLQRAQNDLKTIDRLGFPAGWGGANRPAGWGWWASLLGWAFTAFAILLGAPFWFGLLNKFVNLRGTGPKPASSTSTAASDGTVSPPTAPAADRPDGPALRNTLAKERRSLVIVSATSLTGRADLARLYRLLDIAGPTIAKAELSNRYSSVQPLLGTDATRSKLVETLKLAATSDCQAVDLILMVHGEPDNVVLAAEDGPGTIAVPAADLADDLISLPELNGKLRLCYSTACFGDSHATAFLAAGFTAVIGAKGVNANSATELPLLLRGWARGDSVGSALSHADNAEVRVATDFIARRVGFGDADSEKVLRGDPNTTIDSVPAFGVRN
jgi:hypothetical protein